MDQTTVFDLKEAIRMVWALRAEKAHPLLIYQAGMVLTSSTLLAAYDAFFDNMPKNKSLHGSFLMIFVKDILEDHTSQSSDCVVRPRCEVHTLC